MALHHFALVEIDLRVDAEAADDPGDRIPRHLDEPRPAARGRRSGHFLDGHVTLLARCGVVRSGTGLIASREVATLVPPFGLLVERLEREVAERPDHAAVEPAKRGGDAAARRLVHERHELVGEARHRAADADAADVGATADAAHPAALGHVAFDDRAPAAEFHQ